MNEDYELKYFSNDAQVRETFYVKSRKKFNFPIFEL